MEDRRWLDRLRYAYSLPAAWAREWRKGVMQRLWDYALRNKSFARETVTGAIQRAVEDLQLEIETQATLAEQEIDPDSDVESGAESDGRTGGSSDDESRESSDDDVGAWRMAVDVVSAAVSRQGGLGKWW